MHTNMELDAIDRKILSQLQREGRLSNLELAERVGLSPAACLRRVRTLETNHIISGYCAILNTKELGFDLTVYVEITLASQQAKALEDFERAIQGVDELLEAHLMSGENDYLLKLAVKDLADFERIYRHSLASLPHVAKIKSSFSIRNVSPRLGATLQRRV